MNEKNRSLLALIVSMAIYGTIGVFRNYIGLPSGLLAMLRGFVGALFLLLVVFVSRKRLSLPAIRRNLPILAVSGGLMGVNWILLFEAYRFTTVATATLCYYMAPVIIILMSPPVLRERLTVKKGVCAAVSVFGMVLVSGVLSAGDAGPGNTRGILLGLGAAVLYAAVILLNKKLRDIEAYDKTIVQLLAAAVVLVPYVLLTVDLAALSPTPLTVGMTAIVCVVHTGVAYTLYFGSMKALSAQTLALLSYIDPVVAVILSAAVLRERMTVPAVIGAVLLIGAAVVSELPERHI